MMRQASRLQPLYAVADLKVRGRGFRPPADVYRTDRGWLVKLDLAGVREQDVQVRLVGRQLVVRGIRRDWLVQAGERTWSMEIAYDHFERVIELPSDLGQVSVTSQMSHGMLLVRLQREEA